jgi:integrase
VVWVKNQRVAIKSGFKTKELAKTWHNRKVLEYQQGSPQFQKPKSIPFEELLQRYESIHMPVLSAETRRRYRTDIDGRIKEYFQYRALDSITPLLIESFRSQIMKELKPKSVNNCTELLCSIFRKGVEWGVLEKTPFRLRPLKISRDQYTWWDKKEYVSTFLQNAKPTRYYAAYRLGLECGLRLGEIVGLSKQDVDFKNCRIHIHRQWLNREECYGPTKGRRERHVYFHPKSDLRVALREAIDRSPDEEIIFLTKAGVRVRPRRLAARHFQEVVAKAGVPRIRFHDLRHTFASWYMIEVGDIWSLKGILGHVDVQTTQRYAHLSEKHQRTATLSWALENEPAASGPEISRTKSAPRIGNPNKIISKIS